MYETAQIAKQSTAQAVNHSQATFIPQQSNNRVFLNFFLKIKRTVASTARGFHRKDCPACASVKPPPTSEA